MKQRTVNDLIKDLNKVKAQFGGDIPIKVHLQSLEDANGGDYSHDDFGLYVQEIREVCPDSGKIKRKKWKVLSIFGCEYAPEDYKSKSIDTEKDLNG